ncbi:twin-arginine translocase TatA/TatE family subunit [Chloroflexota bacterium]
MHFGPLEIGLILLIILIIFGAGKLPQIGGAIGKSLHAFRKEQKGEEYKKEPPKAKRKATKKTDTSIIKKVAD